MATLKAVLTICKHTKQMSLYFLLHRKQQSALAGPQSMNGMYLSYLHQAVSMGDKVLCSANGEQSSQHGKLDTISALFSAFGHQLNDLPTNRAPLALVACNKV